MLIAKPTGLVADFWLEVALPALTARDVVADAFVVQHWPNAFFQNPPECCANAACSAQCNPNRAPADGVYAADAVGTCDGGGNALGLTNAAGWKFSSFAGAGLLKVGWNSDHSKFM